MTATPVSLYLDLEEGQKADLEVVARASLAFAGAIRELAYVIDPSLEIKVKLASGTDGSLSLNSILKTADGKDLTLAAIAGIILIWFGNHLLDWTFDEVMDAVTGGTKRTDVTLHLSPEDLKALQQMVNTAVSGHVAQPQVHQVYKELEADPAIKGVGATRVPASRPSNIVPRGEFKARSGSVTGDSAETVTISRHPETKETLILIRPVLLVGHRRWRFAGRQGEFGAPILDDDFLERLVDGRIPVQMSAGIEMDVLLQTTEEKHGDVWVPTAHTVLKVFDVRKAPAQTVLRLPLPSDEDDNDDE